MSNFKPTWRLAVLAIIILPLIVAVILLVTHTGNSSTNSNVSNKSASQQNVLPTNISPTAPAPKPTTTSTSQPNGNALPAIITQFKALYEFPTIGTTLCGYVALGKHWQDLQTLENAAGGYLPEQEALQEYFNYLDGVCSDNLLSQSEIAHIQTLLTNVGSPEGNILKFQTGADFEHDLNAYLYSIWGNPSSNVDCTVINQTTLDSFQASVTTIYKKYNATQSNDDLKQVFVKLQGYCQNGQVTTDQAKAVGLS